MPTAERPTPGTSAMRPLFACPAWCRGCGPNDPMHRSEAVTVGREAAGWLSLQLIVDRFRRREPRLKIDATRYGASQTVLLSATQAARVIEELTHGIEAIQRMSHGRRDGSGSTDG